MRNRFFNFADTAAEAFAKAVLFIVFMACTVYLTIDAGLVGIVFFFVVLAFARWVWHSEHAEEDADDTHAQHDA
ncbi:MAG: hypothetical protein HWE08_12930 [Alphaproteobacteria bacterium]|nr:hypothetical protein [Alphaproteobacteria bacterium]